MEKKPHKEHTRLGQWFATAICGNDILSSALYVSGFAILYAGVFAPLVLLFIGVVLYLYKSVYTEVVEALPINGGAYNCLLNGTSKIIAAIAGITTFLSYIATAVISAKVAVEYLNSIFPIPVMPVTVALLFAFALLVISGLKDSAKVAFGIFVLHVIALSSFLLLGLLFYLNGGSFFSLNLAQTTTIITRTGGIMPMFYLAFAASLLGVSGFESSANFVEEQKEGVFRKTLRNMLVGVAFFNPLIALVVLNSMPYESIINAKDFLLSHAALQIGGSYFQYFIVIDAFLVLSGAVLTSYVGVSGLISRMAGDNCLPNFFAKANKKGSYARVVVTFFLLCTSILFITRGDLKSLAGVYTIAFLGVMSMFAFGNLILKETRSELKRTYHAPILIVMLAFFATVIGILGNIRIDVNNLHFFELYFIPSIIIVFVVIYMDYILRFALRVTHKDSALHTWIQEHFEDITDGKFVAFIHHPERLYKILNYIDRNEIGRNVYLVYCRSSNPHNPKSNYDQIVSLLPALHKAGVFNHLHFYHHFVDEPFGPEVIDKVAKELKVRKNRILIGSIHHFHPYDYSELGGVRIIF